MTTTSLVTGALLWAAAILASAIIGAPALLTLILLPSLAAVSLLTMAQGGRRRVTCRPRSLP